MLLTLLLQFSGAPAGLSNILFIGAIILVFYFFMIRPQQKKVSDQKKFRESLVKGADVITIGGLHGRIVTVDDTTVVLEVDRGTRLTFEKSSIASEVAVAANVNK